MVNLIACAALLCACGGPETLPTPSETPAPSATPTATIAWFPPTVTKTPYPSPAALATQETLPGVGEMLFTEDFDHPESWNTVESPSAAVILEDKQLTLSIQPEAAPILLISLRSEPIVDNFYLEVTARLNLCRGDDRYGVIFRASSSGSYYRYVLNCNGETRFERVSGGQASAPRNWLASPYAPGGAPGEVRIGIWASEAEMRFFLNDRYQYSIEDNTFSSGTIGLFASAQSTTPLSVSFSGMKARAVQYRRATPTRLPSPTP